jgi:geranylgeranyl diphosphate synthase, type I
LGAFGDSSELGKSNLDDIKEGKYTLLLHHALSNGDKSDVDILKRTIGNPRVTDKDLKNVQDVFEKTGARAFVEGRAAWYAERAKAGLEFSNFWDQPSKALFAQMVDYSVKRTL